MKIPNANTLTQNNTVRPEKSNVPRLVVTSVGFLLVEPNGWAHLFSVDGQPRVVTTGEGDRYVFHYGYGYYPEAGLYSPFPGKERG